MRATVADKLMNEVIVMGGLPLRRMDAHALLREAGHDNGTCGMFAFGPNARAVDVEPMSIDEARPLVVDQAA